MISLQTNIYPILNLGQLSSCYRMYRIKNLHLGQEEYYQNCQLLNKRISYELKTPAIVIQRDDGPYLIVKEDAASPPSPYPLVRTAVHFECCREKVNLDYTHRSPENDMICLRFLHFLIQTPLHNNPHLWQANSGGPFYEKRPQEKHNGISIFRGFRIRPIVLSNSSIGLCIDVASKYVCNEPLPHNLDLDTFKRKWEASHCIYHYGHQWYDIRLASLADQNTSEYLIVQDKKLIKLIDYISQNSAKPIPPELAQMPHDCSVVLYKDNRGQERAAPTALCYPTLDTSEIEIRAAHHKSLLLPKERLRIIDSYLHKYVRRLCFGDTYLRIASKPITARSKHFTLPDYRFGSSTTLSVRGTPNAQHIDFKDIGEARLKSLLNKNIGFYCDDPLPKQYFMMPETVLNSYGKRFLEDLCKTVNDLYPSELGYTPTVISYNDKRPKAFIEQGKAILSAFQNEELEPGYGVVMIHDTVDRYPRDEDRLAAMVMRELRDQDFPVTVIHVKSSQGCYEHVRDEAGNSHYSVRKHAMSRLKGYLRNVALNKILLANHRWPFVLASPLHADITIGIDVKQNTVGLTLVSKNGSDIRWAWKTSRQKERLTRKQMASYLMEIIRNEAKVRGPTIRNIAIHRDGMSWQSELEGAGVAIQQLKRDGIIPDDATITFIEIPKHSQIPLRIFEQYVRDDKKSIRNPKIGTYFVVNNREAYICTTGWPFLHGGTVQPLYVRRVEGPMPIGNCIEDVFCLASLTWTRPEDCSRYPITIKLTDRYLCEIAGDYDASELDMAMSENNLRDEGKAI